MAMELLERQAQLDELGRYLRESATSAGKIAFVSGETVDHHVSSIFEKLEVHSRTEAVAAAFGLGIVQPGR